MHRLSTVYKKKQSKTVLSKHVGGFWCENVRTFSPYEALLWIMYSYFCPEIIIKNVLQTCSFSLHKTIIDGVESWIIVMFISCLDSYSDGTHSLQMIHWWASDAMVNFSNLVQWRNNLIYILHCLRVSTCSANSHFWASYSFKIHFLN